MAYISVDINVDLDEFNDEELVSELATRIKMMSKKNKERVQEMFDLMCDELDLDVMQYVLTHNRLSLNQSMALEEYINNELPKII